MRSKVQDTSLQLKVSNRLMADVRADARRKGMSVSEFVRHAVRRELDAKPSASVSKAPTEPMSNDQPIANMRPNGALGEECADAYASASRGDIKAQRFLVQRWYAILSARDLSTPEAWFVAGHALAVTRLAASHCYERDLRMLTAVLCTMSTGFLKAGDGVHSLTCDAESAAICEHLAQSGCDAGAVASQILIERQAPGFVDLVRKLVEETTMEEIA